MDCALKKETLMRPAFEKGLYWIYEEHGFGSEVIFAIIMATNYESSFKLS